MNGIGKYFCIAFGRDLYPLALILVASFGVDFSEFFAWINFYCPGATESFSPVFRIKLLEIFVCARPIERLAADIANINIEIYKI